MSEISDQVANTQAAMAYLHDRYGLTGEAAIAYAERMAGPSWCPVCGLDEHPGQCIPRAEPQQMRGLLDRPAYFATDEAPVRVVPMKQAPPDTSDW